MANYYVSNPIEVVSVGQKVKVRVLEVDEEREKVSLSMKHPTQQQESRYKTQEKKPTTERRDFDEGSSSIRSNITFS
jgi:ribosomal protein S1